jgi:hypothetical protein
MSDFQSKDFEQRNNLKKAGAFHSKNFSKFLRSDVFQFLYRDLGFNSHCSILTVHPKKDIEIKKNKKTPFGQEVSVI